jgi:hypothetical protein
MMDKLLLTFANVERSEQKTYTVESLALSLAFDVYSIM